MIITINNKIVKINTLTNNNYIIIVIIIIK